MINLRKRPDQQESVWDGSLVHVWLALLLANAVYFGKWNAVLDPLEPRAAYFRAEPASAALYISVFGSMAVFALLLYGVMQLAVAKKWISESRLFDLTAAAIVLRAAIMIEGVQSYPKRTAFVTVVFLVLVVIALRWVGTFGKISSLVFVFFSVLLCTQASTFLWRFTSTAHAMETATPRPAAVSTSKAGSPHIVWMVFDELDYELATSLRPASVEMKEFDRLRRESLFATDAHSPADMTAIAFPAFFTGRRVYDVQPNGADDLYLSFGPGHERESWRQQPSIFTAARRRGFNSALVGWHHPYCRVMGDSVSDCFWTPNVDALSSLRRELAVSREGARIVLPGREVLPVNDQYRMVSLEHQDEYQRTLEHALTVVANPGIQLVVLHWLIPHPPGIYDRRQDRLAKRQGSNYFDNLELVDITLGRIRRALEARGLWGDTTFIVTGDHPLRRKIWNDRAVWTTEEDQLSAKRQDPRVPFLVKLPKRSDPVTYDAPFDTVLLHGLTLSWLEGKVSSAAEVSNFIDANRGSFRVHAPDPNETGKRLLH